MPSTESGLRLRLTEHCRDDHSCGGVIIMSTCQILKHSPYILGNRDEFGLIGS